MSQTRSRTFSYSIFLIVVLLVLSCAGFLAPLDFLFNFVFGWLVFLSEVVPQVHVSWAGVVTFGVCLLFLLVGSQTFLRWLYGSTTGNRWNWRWTARLVEGIVLIFVAGLSTTGVAHQVGWLMMSKEDWIESSDYGLQWISQLNLKNSALALNAYQVRRKSYPPGTTFDKLGRPLHGWMTYSLPDLDQQAGFNEINFNLPWDDPANAKPFQQEIFIFQNPGFRHRFKQDDRGYALSHYAGNVHVLGGDLGWKMEAIADGTSQTLLIGEAAGNFKPWGDPVNWRDPALGINKSPRGFGGPSKGGANFAFADGSVHFIDDTINPRVFQALGTPTGGEKIRDQDFDY